MPLLEIETPGSTSHLRRVEMYRRRSMIRPPARFGAILPDCPKKKPLACLMSTNALQLQTLRIFCSFRELSSILTAHFPEASKCNLPLQWKPSHQATSPPSSVLPSPPTTAQFSPTHRSSSPFLLAICQAFRYPHPAPCNRECCFAPTSLRQRHGRRQHQARLDQQCDGWTPRQN